VTTVGPDDNQATRDAEVARLRGKLQNEERFHSRLLDAVQEAVIATDLTGRVLYWNRFAEKLYGWSAAEALGRNVLELKCPAQDQSISESGLKHLQAGGSWSGELVLRRRDGSTFPAHVSDGPLIDDAGKVIGIVGISYDITPRKEAERKQQLLIRELHHRVKNTLATVQAIMGTTARHASSIDEFQESVTGRVMSLAKIHALLTEDQWQEVHFSALLGATLERFNDARRTRIVLDGPPTILPSPVAVPLGMAIHELTVNAVKHGALRDVRGRVIVRWEQVSSDSSEMLCFVWTEHDGPPVKLPTREGFGSRLLRRLLKEQIGGNVRVDYNPDGLRVTVDLPLANRQSAVPVQ
jgi:PAS domain S-box-containing protein